MRAYATLAASLVAWPALALAQVRAGGEFRVNTYTTSAQAGYSVSINARGDFIVAWQSRQDGSGYGIYAQRYDAAGAPRGGEFRVNTVTQADQVVPSVAIQPGGGFMVGWSGYDSDLNGVLAQRYDAAGAPRGGEFVLNTSTTARQSEPSLAADGAGNFVVVWDSGFKDGYGYNYGVFGQRFDAAGVPRGAQFRANSYTTEGQYFSHVASAPDGRFVVVWVSFGQDGSDRGVFGQAFGASGAPIGTEFQANSYTTGYQAEPDAAFDGNGFVVVWTSFRPQDPTDSGVFGQHFSASAARLGSEFRIGPLTSYLQHKPAIAADAAGNYVVAWTSFNFDGFGDAIAAQRYDAAGTPRGALFQVNTYTLGFQMGPAVAVAPSGSFVVTWVSGGQDGNGYGVYAQRFGGLFPIALTVDPTSGNGSNGDGVFEPGERVEVRPQWRNVNGAPQTFSGSFSAIAGPPGAFYTITDASGNYGVVANGATAPCSDCYGVTVTNPPARPATHWDASVLESIVPDAQGQRQRWVLHVADSFSDVPEPNPFFRFIETLLHRGVTGGCSGTEYCPANSTTREQMAVFVLVAKEGAGYVPPPCVPPNIFGDVPDTSPFCRFIEELALRGVVSGCGGGNYCPGDAVTREQMAVFVLRTLDPALNPPACGTPMFADVPASSPFCRWIEELARRGVVTGCGGGNYCPSAPVTREQMGVFLGVTFGLTLYGP